MVNTDQNDTSALSSNEGSSKKRASEKRDPGRSSFFSRARMSFVRSGGDRGASVQVLRGTSGADYEGKAIVHRGGSIGCFCFPRGSGEQKERLVLIKGGFCFVYTDENSKAPKYAIALKGIEAKIISSASPAHHKRTLVSMETVLGDLEYELSFQAEDEAKQFCTVVKEQAIVAERDEARERLGHGQLLHKRASVRYAQNIAKDKVKDQPDAPITTDEIIGNSPYPNMM